MIGDYTGSSQAERGLKHVVDSIVFPVDVAPISWPVFQADKLTSGRPILTYQRRDSRYLSGQDNRLLEMDVADFDIFIWAANENAVLAIMDTLENGFSSYPLRNALMNIRSQFGKLNGSGAAPGLAGSYIASLQTALGDYSPAAQEKGLGDANHALWALSKLAKETGRADWSAIIAALNIIQSNIIQSPGYSYRIIGCRDMTAPEIFQLGLSGRVFSVQAFHSS